MYPGPELGIGAPPPENAGAGEPPEGAGGGVGPATGGTCTGAAPPKRFWLIVRSVGDCGALPSSSVELGTENVVNPLLSVAELVSREGYFSVNDLKCSVGMLTWVAPPAASGTTDPPKLLTESEKLRAMELFRCWVASGTRLGAV